MVLVISRSALNWHVVVRLVMYIVLILNARPFIAATLLIAFVETDLFAQHLQGVIALLEVAQQQFVQLGPIVQGALP